MGAAGYSHSGLSVQNLTITMDSHGLYTVGAPAGVGYKGSNVPFDPNDVGASLAQSGVEADLLGKVRQRQKAMLAITVIAHEDRHLATIDEHVAAIGNHASQTS